jgi:uncharacterized protein YxjI
MSLFFPGFFESNEYFIDEKVGLFKFHNAYKVYDATGTPMGAVTQKVPVWQKIVRLVLNKKMLPFELHITDNDEQVVTTIHRGWTFWLSKISIRDGSGNEIGFIKQKFSFLKPRFQIFDVNGGLIAIISGDWKAWNFNITDEGSNVIGVINKKWAGIAKEFFTSADKYHVSIAPEYAEDRNKMNIVATAITIDMVLKESS